MSGHRPGTLEGQCQGTVTEEGTGSVGERSLVPALLSPLLPGASAPSRGLLSLPRGPGRRPGRSHPRPVPTAPFCPLALPRQGLPRALCCSQATPAFLSHLSPPRFSGKDPSAMGSRPSPHHTRPPEPSSQPCKHRSCPWPPTCQLQTPQSVLFPLARLSRDTPVPRSPPPSVPDFGNKGLILSPLALPSHPL